MGLVNSSGIAATLPQYFKPHIGMRSQKSNPWNKWLALTLEPVKLNFTKVDGAMVDRPNVLERAFELANSGKYDTIPEIKQILQREGFGLHALAGKVLFAQLRTLICRSKLTLAG